MNSVHLIGRLTAQPTIHYTATQKAVAEATIVVDDPTAKNPDGSKKAYFFPLVIWSPKAEVCHQHLVKGQKVGITGRLTQQTFTPKGSDREVTKTRIIVDTIDFLEKPAGHQQQPQSPAAPPTSDPTPPPDLPDDIPF